MYVNNKTMLGINKGAFTGIIINIVLIFLVINIQALSERNWVVSFFAVVVAGFIINILVLKHINKRFLTFSIAYYALAILFNLSQIYVQFVKSTTYYNIFNLVPMNICKESFFYGFLCIHLMIISYYFFYNKFNKIYSYKEKKNIEAQIKLVKYIFWIFFAFKWIVRVYHFILSMRYGYLDALSMISDSLSGTIVMVADVFSIVYLSYSVSKRRKLLFCVLISLEIIFMLSGSRIYGTTYILILLLTLVNIEEKQLTSFNKMILLIGGVFGFVFLEAIMNSRLTSSKLGLSFMEDGGLLFQLCKEFGLTMLDTANAIQYQDNIKYLHGLSYFGSIMVIFPNIGGFYGGLLKKLVFVNQLKEFFSWNYGGSNVAESFFNFGYLGIIVFIPIGILVRFIEVRLKEYKQYSIGTQLSLLAFVYEFIIWNRNCFFNCVRLPIWLFIIWIIAKNLIRHKNE